MENDLLKSALDAEICRQVREATPSTPRYVVLGRVVETVCDYLNLPVTSLPDYKNTIRLDESLKTAIQECWYLRGGDSYEELEKILAKDYHKPGDMIRFVGILWKRVSKHIPNTKVASKLYEILSVDGYLGDDLKRYVDYLKIASTTNDAKSIHVYAVRRMYREGVVLNPLEMYSVLQTAFGLRPCETERDEELKKMYVTLVGDALERICEWKMQQSQEESKRKENVTVKKRKNEHEPVKSQDESKKRKMEPAKKRGRKSKNPVKIQVPANPSPPHESSFLPIESSSEESDDESGNESEESKM